MRHDPKALHHAHRTCHTEGRERVLLVMSQFSLNLPVSLQTQKHSKEPEAHPSGACLLPFCVDICVVFFCLGSQPRSMSGSVVRTSSVMRAVGKHAKSIRCFFECYLHDTERGESLFGRYCCLGELL